METNYTQIWITVITALAVIVPAALAYNQARKAAQEARAIREEQKALALKVDANTALTVETKGQVVELKKNTDGMTADLLTLTARASNAEGQIAGAAGERDRPPEMVTEPNKVHEAMNGKDVRAQIDAIEAGTARIENHAHDAAEDRVAAYERADDVDVGEPGAAADASAKREDKG